MKNPFKGLLDWANAKIKSMVLWIVDGCLRILASIVEFLVAVFGPFFGWTWYGARVATATAAAYMIIAMMIVPGIAAWNFLSTDDQVQSVAQFIGSTGKMLYNKMLEPAPAPAAPAAAPARVVTTSALFDPKFVTTQIFKVAVVQQPVALTPSAAQPAAATPTPPPAANDIETKLASLKQACPLAVGLDQNMLRDHLARVTVKDMVESLDDSKQCTEVASPAGPNQRVANLSGPAGPNKRQRDREVRRDDEPWLTRKPARVVARPVGVTEKYFRCDKHTGKPAEPGNAWCGDLPKR